MPKTIFRVVLSALILIIILLIGGKVRGAAIFPPTAIIAGNAVSITTNNPFSYTINSVGSGGTNAVLPGAGIAISTNGVQYTINVFGGLLALYTNNGINLTNLNLLLATNESLRQATSITNGAIFNLSNLLATLSANATNQSLKIGLNDTNESLRQATSITNGAVNNLSNLLSTLSLNATNEALLLSMAATNEALRQATSLTNGAILNLSNYVFTLSQNGTNNDIAVAVGNGLVASTNSRLVTIAASIAAGTNVIVFTNNGVVTIASTASVSGSGTNAVAPGNGILVVTNGPLYTVNWNLSNGWQYAGINWSNNPSGSTFFIGSNYFGMALTNGSMIAWTNGVLYQTGGGTNTAWFSNEVVTTSAIFQNLISSVRNGVTNGLQTVYNALDFGAIPGDGNDDTAAIQSALDAAGTNGGTVFIPAGAYTITGTLHQRSDTSILGEHAPNGGAGTRLDHSGSGLTIMLPFQKGYIANLFLNGGGAGAHGLGIGTTNTADIVQSTTHWKIENVRAFGFEVGFFFHNSWVGELNTCYADNGVDGVVLSNITSAIRIVGGEYSQCTNGIHFRGGNHFGDTISSTMENCSGAGVFMDDSLQGYNLNIRVINSYFEGNTNAIVTTNTEAMVIEGNVLESLGTNIIMNGDNRSARITGNYFGGASPWNIGNGSSAILHGNNFPNTTFPGIDASTSGVAMGTNLVLRGSSGFFGLITTGSATNATGDRVLYLSDTNGLGGGSANSLTNNQVNAVRFMGPFTVGTNATGGETVIDAQGNIGIYIPTNSPGPLFVVSDVNTNPVFEVFGSNSTVKVTGLLTVSNLTSRLRFYPTGTNSIIFGISTNAAGAIVTNTITLGNDAYNLRSQNTNSVNTISLTQDGILNVGTNNDLTLDTSGNLVIKGSYYGLVGSGNETNAAGSRVAYMTDISGSSGISVDAGTGTNTTIKGNFAGTNAVYVDTRGLIVSNNISRVDITNGIVTASGAVTAGTLFQGNGGSISNLNGGAITGGVWRVDVPGFAMVPADSGSMTFVTNTPSNTSTSIQGAGPSRMMWQITSAGTNLFINFPMPYNYDGGTVTAELWFTGGTNGVTKTTNVVTCSASTFGSALGTAVKGTNRIDTVGVSTFWTTNMQLGPLTIGGSPAAGRSVTFQFSVNNTDPQFSITNLLYAHHASVWGTASSTQRGSIVMP